MNDFFLFAVALNNKSINFASKIDFTSAIPTQSGVMCMNSLNNSLRMVEKWLKEDNYITTPSTIAIKWIRKNQFSLSSGELCFLRQKNVFKLFTANAIKHDINSLCIHHRIHLLHYVQTTFYIFHFFFFFIAAFVRPHWETTTTWYTRNITRKAKKSEAKGKKKKLRCLKIRKTGFTRNW